MTEYAWLWAAVAVGVGLLIGEIGGSIGRASMARSSRSEDTRNRALAVSRGVFWGSVAVGLLLFALVSWMPKPVPLVVLWGGLFVFLPILSRILTFAMREPGMRRRDALEESPWRLLDFWNDLYIVGNKFFGVDKPLFTGAAVVVCAVCIISAVAIVVRLRQLQHQS